MLTITNPPVQTRSSFVKYLKRFGFRVNTTVLEYAISVITPSVPRRNSVHVCVCVCMLQSGIISKKIFPGPLVNSIGFISVRRYVCILYI